MANEIPFLKAIKKSLASKYSAQFDAEDKMLASKASREVMERRQTLTSEFTAWRTSLLSRHSADKAKRDKLRGLFFFLFYSLGLVRFVSYSRCPENI